MFFALLIIMIVSIGLLGLMLCSAAAEADREMDRQYAEFKEIQEAGKVLKIKEIRHKSLANGDQRGEC